MANTPAAKVNNRGQTTDFVINGAVDMTTDVLREMDANGENKNKSSIENTNNNSNEVDVDIGFGDHYDSDSYGSPDGNNKMLLAGDEDLMDSVDPVAPVDPIDLFEKNSSLLLADNEVMGLEEGAGSSVRPWIGAVVISLALSLW
ncbi:hypothetical protein TRVA0_026S00342 [Trichomonascus vanleenenianus]|uniref:uncharacterized protein n=1 Tax=Trichomonascus vanleenenianus TaxID=2268995 RepID=UPI003ECB07A0